MIDTLPARLRFEAKALIVTKGRSPQASDVLLLNEAADRIAALEASPGVVGSWLDDALANGELVGPADLFRAEEEVIQTRMLRLLQRQAAAPKVSEAVLLIAEGEIYAASDVEAEIRHEFKPYPQADSAPSVATITREQVAQLAALNNRCKAAEQHAEALAGVLRKIATVNACDYEYQRWAREALAARDGGAG